MLQLEFFDHGISVACRCKKIYTVKIMKVIMIINVSLYYRL